MGPDAKNLVFWILSFKSTFLFSSFTFIKRIFSSSLSAIRVVSSVYLRLLNFSQQSWFQLVLHPVQHFSWCTLHRSEISRVTTYTALMYSFPHMEPTCHSMSSSNSYILIYIHIFQEAGQVVWYFHLFKNFTQFVVIYTVKGFGIVNKPKLMFFWNSLTVLMIQQMLAIWSLFPLPYLNPAWTSQSSWFTYCWSLVWRILSISLLVCERSTIVR